MGLPLNENMRFRLLPGRLQFPISSVKLNLSGYMPDERCQLIK